MKIFGAIRIVCKSLNYSCCHVMCAYQVEEEGQEQSQKKCISSRIYGNITVPQTITKRQLSLFARALK